MRPFVPLLPALLLLASAGPLPAGPAAKSGYLDPGAFDLLQVLPPAPVKGDARYQADRKIFKSTRKMLATPRGALATSDAVTDVPAMMRDFSCSVGVALTPQNAPLTAALVTKAAHDTAAETNAAKNFYKRRRPFLIDNGPICQSKPDLAKSYDYPSGHTTWGWTWATVLAELAPDRATPIMARGRAYGDSRFICGAHNESAVEAGKLSAGATMSVVRLQPAYQADLAAARAEMDALRRDPDAPRPQGCEEEAKLVRQRVL